MMLHESRFQEILAGKTVALVGPADTLINSGLGAHIESHDVVVRLNSVCQSPLAAPPADYGTRTDVLYSSLNDRPHCFIKDLANQLVVCPFPRVKPYQVDIDRESSYFPRLVVLGAGLYDAFILAYQSRPFTGTLTCAHLLSMPIKRLWVGGFSFYRTHSYAGYTKLDHATTRQIIKKSKHHIFSNDEKYMLGLLRANVNRVEVDPFLQGLLAETAQQD